MKNFNNKSLAEGEITSSTSSSLVARAGQVMAVIIAFGLLSMISSILVSESLSGDAAQINNAGALRMQATRISRAQLLKLVNEEKVAHASQSIKVELELFRDRFEKVFSGGFNDVRENQLIEQKYQIIQGFWAQLAQSTEIQSLEFFESFVQEIDELVTLLQVESEKKLRILRLIQGVSLFSILLVVFIVLYKINRIVITPLKQLVEVATEAGRGNFTVKAGDYGDNELGVLAQTINQMSDELKSTYQDFEERVESKTRELIRSNRSLEVLYRAASNLTDNLTDSEYHQSDKKIIQQLEPVLGFGKVTIERNVLETDAHIIAVRKIDNFTQEFCLKRLEYPLEKQTQHFGCLVWHIPIIKEAADWQVQILQAMADIIATAIELEQKRNTEDRLLIYEERAVIARELHDSLAQSLSYLKVQMSLLTRKVQKDLAKEQLSETIEDIKQGLNSAYQQLRELLTNFRLKLDDPSIENALRGTVIEFGAKCNHPVTLKFDVPANYLTANQEIHVLQIVREALSNIHKHANATNAGVILLLNNDKVKVEIWDNGQGFSCNTERHGHFGLRIMEERAKSLHTEICLNSDSRGTSVEFEFERQT